MFHPQGDGDNTVVLIDNVRDDNFYDLNNTQGFTYVAGFFSSQINELFDRNVMTIDAFDWLHRTGANPPHEPVPGNNCTSAAARPFLYEGVFAHEYQHLLENYEDGDEVNWINEGLADWAQTLTGYANPARPITQIGFDGHTQCFLGWLTVDSGQPESACDQRAGELAHAVGRPGRRRSPLRLRRRVHVDGVLPRALRHRLHDGAAPWTRTASRGCRTR